MDTLNCIVRYGFALLLAAAATAVGDEVLLLKHGGLLSGQITEDEASFVIRGQGQEFRIDKSRIAGRFSSGTDAYEWLVEKLEKSGAPLEGRLKLAEWCLKNDLPKAAHEQLSIVSRAEPDHPRVPQLTARLAQNYQQARPANDAPRLVPTPRAERVEQASFEPAAPPRLAVPPSELSDFTRRVQPLLVNNCTTSGCHQQSTDGGPSPHGFTLDRSLLHGYADARSTDANLRSVLELIDPTSPDSSPLLVAATGPHAGIQPLKGTRREAWLARLHEWVQRVVDANVTEGASDAPIRDNAVTPASFESEAESRAPLVEPKSAASPTESEFQPRDEFDPELFNRRYGQASTPTDSD